MCYHVSTIWLDKSSREGITCVAESGGLWRIRIFPFRIPGQKGPGSPIRIRNTEFTKNLSIFNPKIIAKL